jgi:hypothetical protein
VYVPYGTGKQEEEDIRLYLSHSWSNSHPILWITGRSRCRRCKAVRHDPKRQHRRFYYDLLIDGARSPFVPVDGIGGEGEGDEGQEGRSEHSGSGGGGSCDSGGLLSW